MATSDTQELQLLINQIIELRAQLAEVTAEAGKFQNIIANNTFGTETAMPTAFLDAQLAKIKEIEKELSNLSSKYSATFSQTLFLPAPSGKQTTPTNISAVDRRREEILRESSSAEIPGGAKLPENYIESWNQIGRAVPEAAGALREFLNVNKIVFQDLNSISLDKDSGFASFTGEVQRAQGAVENFNYTINQETGLREYSGTVKYTNGIMEKFSITTDALGNKIENVNKEAFDPTTFSDYGKQAEKLLTTIHDLGFETTDLKDVQEEASTNIRRYTLAARDQEGVMRRATITTDKFGNILQDTQKRFRGFFSTIARNTAEVIKWTVAVQLTYKPLMKMYELIEIMIDNEAKLADITVALGESYESLNDIFTIAADIATETGSSIKGVLEGYELAYRATGGIVDATERAATAQQLLVDSMVLSKVSTLDQATALDTLAGGLLQIGEELNKGQELLDKWVAVSKRANVSIGTLAESFAITASSAEGAGLSLDQLNGVIATVAENTTLSATEVGNAVRAFISGFQTDTAVRELSKFGVLVKNSGQENLDFLDVMKQVKSLFDEGLISKSQLNEIAEAIGGGARRGAQVVAFLKNLERVTEVSTVSSLAAGDAQEALAIKMETLKTKSVLLENAFVKLGQALGSEGGILDGAKIAIKAMTGMVDIVTKLTDSLGPAIPVLLAYAVAMSQINKVGGLAAFGGMMSEGLLGMKSLGVGGIAAGFGPEGAWKEAQVGEVIGLDKTRNKLLTNMSAYLKTPGGAGKLMGGAGVALTAAGSFAAGDKWRGIGNIAGGAIALAFSANPLLAIAGSAIGGGLLDSIKGQEVEFKDFFAGIIVPGTDDGKVDKTKIEKLQDRQKALTDEIVKTAGDFGTWFVQTINNNWRKLPWNLNKGQDMTFGQAALGRLGMGNVEDKVALGNYIAQMNELADYEKILGGEITSTLPLFDKRNTLIEENKGLIDSLILKYRDLAFEERLAGDITNKQFTEINDTLSSLGINVGGYVAAFGDEFIKLRTDVDTTAEAFESLTLALTHGNEADVIYLAGLLTDIAEAQYKIREGTDVAGNTALISDREVKGAQAIQLILKDIAKTSYKLPTIIDVLGLDTKELGLVKERAVELRNTRDEALFGLGFIDKQHTEEEFKNIFDPIMLNVGRSGAAQLIEGISEADFKDAMSELGEEGKISLEEGFGLMDFTDLTTEQFNKLAAESVRLGNLADEATGGALELNWKTFGAITSDSITGPVTAELTLLQALMKDLIEVNEDQVEGIYNLPTDGSFFVPFEGYQKGFGGGGGGASDEFMRKFLMFLDQFPKPEEVQDVFVTNMEIIDPRGNRPGGALPPQEPYEKPALEDYFRIDQRANRPGGILPPQQPYANPEIQEEELFRPLGQNIDSLINLFSGLGEVFKNLGIDIWEGLKGLFTDEEILSSGEGAGGPDIVESLKGLGSIEELIAYFTSGGFHEDAMKSAPESGEMFGKIIDALKSLEIFNPYVLEEILSSGGGGGGVLKSPTEAPTSGLIDILKGLLAVESPEELLKYFTSGQFHEDAMKGGATTGENFNKLLELFAGLEIFNLYGEDGQGPEFLTTFVDAIRDLFGLGTGEEQAGGQSSLSDSVSELAMATQQLNETGILTLNLEINSDTKLTLDSQVIGTVIKEFIYEELLKREGASSASTTKVFTMG